MPAPLGPTPARPALLPPVEKTSPPQSFASTLPRSQPPPEAKDSTLSFDAILRGMAERAQTSERGFRQSLKGANEGGYQRLDTLIALQGELYRYSQEIEFSSKVLEKAASSLRQILQSNT